MAITYLIDFPCPVKEQVAPKEMLFLLYARERANEALNRARREKSSVDPDDVGVSLTLPGKGGSKGLLKLTASEVQDRFSPLDVLSAHCSSCKARVEAHAFGCRGVVGFPLSFRAERFLMGLIHGGADSPSPRILLDFFDAQGITGNRMAELRQLDDVFFESRRALVRRYETGERISVHQVLEALFQMGTHSPQHAGFLLEALDLLEPSIPLDVPRAELPHLFVAERFVDGALASRCGVRVFAKESDDRGTRQLKHFFGALLLAASFGHPLRVEM